MTSPFQEALGAELRAAAYRDLERRRRRRLRTRVGAAFAAVVAAVTGTFALWPSAASAGIDVRVRDGNLEVRIVDLQTDPREVAREMEAHGLPVEVMGIPTGPSAVGRFVSLRLDEGVIPITRSGSDGYSFDGFIVPDDYPGKLLIGVGVEAKRGQGYDYGSDALAPGEPMACQDVIGLRVSEVEAPEGIDLVVFPVPATVGAIDLDDPAADPYRDWYVRSADAMSASQVFLTASPDPVPHKDPPC